MSVHSDGAMSWPQLEGRLRSHQSLNLLLPVHPPDGDCGQATDNHQAKQPARGAHRRGGADADVGRDGRRAESSRPETVYFHFPQGS
eukprot:scaffold224015_cov35-Tisochrysis_lutea.AAC.1